MNEEAAPTPTLRKPRIFYPILFAVFPILSIYSANLELVPGQSIVRPLLFVVAVAIGLWILLGFVLKSFERAALTSSFVIAACFLFSRFVVALRLPFYLNYLAPILWAIILIAGSILAAKRAAKGHKLLNVLSLALVLTSVVQIAIGVLQSSILRPAIQRSGVKTGTNLAIRPDIIYIILDGYGRSDALQRAMGYSSEAFVEGLEKRGFYVAKDAHSNYCQTELSVASSLNMEFIPDLLPKVGRRESNRSPLDVIIDFNRVALYLRERGYSYAAITTGFPPLQFYSADVNLKSQIGLNLIESAVVQMTPFSTVPSVERSMYDRRRETILDAFTTLETLSSNALTPRFTVVHILAPHPPFVFEANGEPRPHHGSFGFFDGSDYMENVSTAKDYRNGYTGQAEYIGTRTLQAIDALLAGSGPKPVILVQGDHGSKLRLNQSSLAKTDVNECFPNLSAYYVPEAVEKNLYAGITPVNSFRVLFNGLFDDKFDLKPDQSWYSTYPSPYDFTEVTSQIADHTKMSSVPLPR